MIAVSGVRSRTAVLAVAAVVAVLLASWLAPTAGARESGTVVRVRPSQLSTGASPRVAWFDSELQLHRPGHDPVQLDGGLSSLMHARGGWVVGSAGAVRLLEPSGESRVLHPYGAFEPAVVTRDGRRLVEVRSAGGESDGREVYTLRVVRIADGAVVARHRVGRTSQLAVLGASRSTVAYTTWEEGRKPRALLRIWDVRSGRERHYRSDGLGTLLPADTAHHRAAVRKGRRSVMIDTRTGRRLWRTSPGEAFGLLSPSGRRILTFDDRVTIEGSWYASQTLRVRDARTGRLVRTFRGGFVRTRPHGPGGHAVWETDRSFLVGAGDRIVRDDDEVRFLQGQAVVRCTVRGRCQRVSEIDTEDRLVIRQSN